MESKPRVLAIATAAALAFTLAACSAQTGAGGAAPTMTPAQQCETMQAVVDTADLAAVLVDVKDAKARAGIDAAFAGLDVAVADYCDAASRGETVDALTTALRSYRAALAEFRRQVRAARGAPEVAPVPPS